MAWGPISSRPKNAGFSPTELRISTGTKIYITKRKRKIGCLARVAKVGLPEFHILAEGKMLSSSEEVSEEYKRVCLNSQNPIVYNHLSNLVYKSFRLRRIPHLWTIPEELELCSTFELVA